MEVAAGRPAAAAMAAAVSRARTAVDAWMDPAKAGQDAARRAPRAAA
jgi:hypothetical protein